VHAHDAINASQLNIRIWNVLHMYSFNLILN